MSYIFMSYSRADKTCAYKLQRQFEAQGFKVWIDRDDIPVGAAFPNNILNAIRNAAAVLILWSANAAKSHFVGKEIEEALSQKLIRSMPVIPVWLDDEPLRPELAGLNAMRLENCTDAGIDNLIRRMNTVRSRKIMPFHADKSLAEQGAQPLTGMGALSVFPIMGSVYCKARIVAPPSASLAAVKAHPQRTVQVFFEFLGSVNNAAPIQKIYESLSATQPDMPFFLFHFTGHEAGLDYKLTDDPENSPNGDWLDPVNAVQQTMDGIVGRGAATLQIFNALPASLNFALGTRFYNFWRVQLFHLPRGAQHYQMVLDTVDL